MDKFVRYLEDYNRRLEPIIDEVFEKEKAHVSKIAPIASSMIIKNF